MICHSSRRQYEHAVTHVMSLPISITFAWACFSKGWFRFLDVCRILNSRGSSPRSSQPSTKMHYRTVSISQYRVIFLPPKSLNIVTKTSQNVSCFLLVSYRRLLHVSMSITGVTQRSEACPVALTCGMRGQNLEAWRVCRELSAK